MLIYYERLCGYAYEDLDEAIGECIDDSPYFPDVSEVLKKINSPRSCIHHVKQAELREREAILQAREKAGDEEFVRIREEIGRLQAFRKEVAEEKARRIRETDLPKAESELADLQTRIVAAGEELAGLKAQCDTERRRLQLLDQAGFLKKMKVDEGIPQ